MEKITDSKERLNDVSALHRICYLRRAALQEHIEELESPLITALVGGGSGDLNVPQNNLSGIVSLFHSDALGMLAKAREAMRLLEASQDFLDAVKVMEPLLELVAADNAEIEEHRRLMGEASNAEREALEAARTKAEAKIAAEVDRDPRVIKAREALAGIKRLGKPLEDAARELAADLH
jgi:hypothetical protein